MIVIGLGESHRPVASCFINKTPFAHLPPPRTMTSRCEQVCSWGGSRYLIASEAADTVSIPNDWAIERPSCPLPITVLRLDGIQSITSLWLQRTIDSLLSSDDVFCKDFLSYFVFQHPPRAPLPEIAHDVSASRKPLPNWVFSTGDLLPGPYVFMDCSIHKVFKLFPDPYCAFMCGVVQSEQNPKMSAELCIL